MRTKLSTVILVILLSFLIFVPQHTAEAASFVQEQKLTAVNFTGIEVPTNDHNMQFGSSVAVNSADTWMVVGSPHTGSPANAGQIRFYERVGGEWLLRQTVNSPVATAAFGFDVAIDGTTAIVSSPFTTVSSQASAGAAFVYTLNAGTWTFTRQVNAPVAAANDLFGYSVSIAGDIVAVGAPYRGASDNGSFFIFERNLGGANNWGYRTEVAGTVGLGLFGYSLELSGTSLIVGAPYSTLPSGTGAGRAVIHSQNQGGTNIWGLQSTLVPADANEGDAFGFSVSLSGTRAVVGAPQHDAGANNAGAVYTFDATVQTAKVTNPGAAQDDFFGYSVAVTGNNLLVGAPFDNGAGTDSGSAYTFVWNGASWGSVVTHGSPNGAEDDLIGSSVDIGTNLAAVGAPNDAEVTNAQVSRVGSILALTNSGGWAVQSEIIARTPLPQNAASDGFGQSVAYSPDGTLLAIGTASDDQAGPSAGAVHLYSFNGTSWEPVSKIFPARPVGAEFFGVAVAFDSANRLYVTAPHFSGGIPTSIANQGAVYRFENVGGQWVQTLRRLAPTPSTNSSFGSSLAIAGDVIVVGSGANRAYAYTNPDLTSPTTLTGSDIVSGDAFGYAVAAYDPNPGTPGDETIVVSAPNKDSVTGAVYVFTGASYATETKLTLPTGIAGDRFGWSVAVSGTEVVVSTPTRNANDGGVFAFSGADYSTVTPITPAAPVAGSQYGYNLDLRNSALVVGAPFTGNGRAFVFNGSGTTWTEQGTLTAVDGTPNDQFGFAVAMNSGSFVVGANTDDVAFTDDGSAYVFSLAPEVVLAPVTLALDETGETTDTFTVSVNQAPAVNVTVELTFDANVRVDTGSGFGASPQTITLTPANAISGVTVSVQAVDDAIDEADPHNVTITTGNTASAAPLFNGLAVADVSVSITDNDTSGITVTQSDGGNAVTEDGATDTYSIVLDSQPTSTVTYEITFPASDVTVNGDTDGLFATTFNTGNWNTPQTITIAAVNDRNLEGNHSATLVHNFLSVDSNYNGATALVDGTTSTNTLNVDITDNETATLAFAPISASAAEGTSNTANVIFTIVANPTGGSPALEGVIDYTINLAFVSAELADLGSLTGSSNFTNAASGAANAINIPHLNDTLVEGDETYTLTIDSIDTAPTGTSIGANDVFTGTITDADTATVALSGGATVSEAVGTHNVTVTLTMGAGNTLADALVIPVELTDVTAAFNGLTGDMYFNDGGTPVTSVDVTFPAGSVDGATQTAAVTIINDRTVEASTLSSAGFNTPEQFEVTFGTLPSAVTATTAVTSITIDENDFAYITMNPTFTVNDVIDVESNTDRTSNVQVRIVADGTGTVQVQDSFTVPLGVTTLGQPNDATAGADYVALPPSPSVTFPAGAANNAQQPLNITIIDDPVDEFYGALGAFNRNREFFDVGFNDPAVRASYAGVPILIPDIANDNCNGTGGLPNLPGVCRSRHTNIIFDNDEAGVFVMQMGGDTAVVEGGAGDDYSVVLTSRPTANVTVNVAFDNTQLTLNGDTDGTLALEFTPANWNFGQVVNVTAVDDTLIEENPHTRLITQTITSTDPIYSAINPADVTVSITDNDTATITFASASSAGPETAASYNVTARLDLVTNGTPGGTLGSALSATVNVANGTAEAADYTLNTATVTFSPGAVNGATQIINLSLINDRLLEGDEDFTLSFTLSAGTGSVSGTHTVTITDDESAVVEFVDPSSIAPEGIGSHNMDLRLAINGTGTGDAQLESMVSIDINVTPITATTPADFNLFTVSAFFLPGVNSPIPETITLTIVNDTLVEGDEDLDLGFGTITGSGDITATGTHTATITDNDFATVGFVPNDDVVNENIGTFSKNVLLTIVSNPPGGTLAGSVTVPLVYTEGSALQPEDYTPIVGTLIFSAGATDGATLSARANIIDDAIDEDTEFFTISIDTLNVTGPASLGRTSTRVDITDNDTAAIAVSPMTLNLDETGSTSGSYTVVLESQPTADVGIEVDFNAAQIDVSLDSGFAALETSPLTLTFTDANWDTPQTVYVRAVDDSIAELSPHTVTLVQSATSTDAKYAAINPQDVVVSITDNDTPGVSVSLTSIDLDEGSPATTASYNVTLDSIPAADVTVEIAFDTAQIAQVNVSGTPYTVSPAVITFTPLNWNTPQTVEVTVNDDNIDEVSPHFSTLVQTTTSSDTSYNNIATDDVTANIIDNDTAAVQLSPTTVTVAETGATGIYTIEALTQPAADVEVTLTFNDAQIRVDGQVSPYVVTLTPADFSVDVVVSAVNDDFDETDPHIELITHAIASADPFYDALPDGEQVTVEINDNDTASVVFSSQQLFSNEGDSIPTALTVQLASQPTAAVTVELAFDTQITLDGTTTTPLVIIFQPEDWDTPVTVDVLAVDDLVDEADPHNSGITPSATSSDPLYNGAAVVFTPDNVITVTIGDNDTAGVSVTEASGTINDNSITVNEGGAGSSFNVVLDTEPTANVEVSMTFNDTEIRAGSPTPGASPLSLIFTPANWDTPQTVNVEAVNDVIFQNIGTSNISMVVGSFDPFYAGAPFSPNQTLVVNIIDDEAPSLVFTNIDGTPLNQLTDVVVREEFTNDQYRVELNSQPLGDVTVTLTFDAAQLQVGANGNPVGGSPLILTFTAANWNIPQIIEVQGIEDFALDAGTQIITHDPASVGDVYYNALVNEAVTVSVQDGITTPPDSFALIRPANNIFIPDPTLLTAFRWEDTFNTGSPGTMFNLRITNTASGTNILTFINASRVVDGDALSCDGTECVLTIGAFEQSFLTDGTYSWTVTAINGFGSTSSNEAFTFTIDTTGNLLYNSGFEIAGDTIRTADGWLQVDTLLTDRRKCNTATQTVARTGDCVWQFKYPDPGVLINPRRGIRQVILQPPYGIAGDVLTLTGWVNGRNLEPGTRLRIVVRYPSGEKVKTNIMLPDGTFDWTEVSGSNVLTDRPARIIIVIQSRAASGRLRVDDLSLKLTSDTAPLKNQVPAQGSEAIPLPAPPEN